MIKASGRRRRNHKQRSDHVFRANTDCDQQPVAIHRLGTTCCAPSFIVKKFTEYYLINQLCLGKWYPRSTSGGNVFIFSYTYL